MKTVKTSHASAALAIILTLILAPFASAQTAQDENNQNRAIGLAHSAPGVAECLAAAQADGQPVNPEARGQFDENGELTIWRVVFFGGLDLGGNRIVLAIVDIEDWQVVASECRYPS